VLSALRAARRSLDRSGREDVWLWPWCDNQGSVDLLNDRNLDRRLDTVEARLVAWAEMLYRVCSFRVSWCPAEHDTNCRNIISILNKMADSLAKSAFASISVSVWRIPAVWQDGETTWLSNDKGLICNVRGAVKAAFTWVACLRPSSVEAIEPFAFWQDWLIPASLSECWTKWAPLHPRDAAMGLLCARYRNVWDFYIDLEGHGLCAVCGLVSRAICAHRTRECPAVHVKMAQCMEAIACGLRPHMRRGCVVERVWGGLRLSREKCEVDLLWSPPQGVSHALLHGNNHEWWPVFLGMTPNKATWEHAACLFHTDFPSVCRIVVRLVSQGGMQASKPEARATSNYWRRPVAALAHCGMRRDRLLHLISEDSVVLSVPTSVLWSFRALLSASLKSQLLPACPVISQMHGLDVVGVGAPLRSEDGLLNCGAITMVMLNESFISQTPSTVCTELLVCSSIGACETLRRWGFETRTIIVMHRHFFVAVRCPTEFVSLVVPSRWADLVL
jgi:hypothetical protein